VVYVNGFSEEFVVFVGSFVKPPDGSPPAISQRQFNRMGTQIWTPDTKLGRDQN
jgi:hypothetical protein